MDGPLRAKSTSSLSVLWGRTRWLIFGDAPLRRLVIIGWKSLDQLLGCPESPVSERGDPMSAWIFHVHFLKPIDAATPGASFVSIISSTGGSGWEGWVDALVGSETGMVMTASSSRKSRSGCALALLDGPANSAPFEREHTIQPCFIWFGLEVSVHVSPPLSS